MTFRIIWLLLAAGILAAVAIVGIALMENTVISGREGSIHKFESADELKAYLLEHRSEPMTGYYRHGAPGSTAADSKELQAGGGGGSLLSLPPIAASDYSTTNLQVRGVDEADYVKNDGTYLYLLSGGSLVIITAYPADQARIISTTPVTGTPIGMFLEGDRLVLFASGSDEILLKTAGSIAPIPARRQGTEALVYDISDRSAPELQRTIHMTGTYYNSRMIEGYVYIVTTEPVQYYSDDPVMPLVTTGHLEITPEVYYFDMPCPTYLYQTITSFQIRGQDPPNAESLLVGPSSTLYASSSNVYLAYQRSIPAGRWAEIQPATPAGAPGYSREGTIIHKFSIDKGEVRYTATGDVPGHLLNQFSMDEHDRHLRVATTVEDWTSPQSLQFNNVYILDDGMQTVGRIEYIAPDERIYSTRFIGDRLYMVTFKRIDPFYVIDLSDPAHPGILGKLKLPGFSDYLHPYDTDHIIGIGRETEDNQWGGVSTGGLKLALFDVSDVNSPALVDQVVIGEAGSDSEALRDHRAFLLDPSRDLLVIPVEEILNIPLQAGKGAPYSPGYWNGAYIFGITPEAGFIVKGKVAHGSDPGMVYRTARVTRSLYMDEILSTISSTEVILTDLDHPGEPLSTIALPHPVYRGGNRPWE